MKNWSELTKGYWQTGAGGGEKKITYRLLIQLFSNCCHKHMQFCVISSYADNSNKIVWRSNKRCEYYFQWLWTWYSEGYVNSPKVVQIHRPISCVYRGVWRIFSSASWWTPIVEGDFLSNVTAALFCQLINSFCVIERYYRKCQVS